MTTLKPLTRNQLAIFSFCREWLDEKQSFPSIRVIASAFGFDSQNSASCYLKALAKKGYIEKWEHEYKCSVRNKKAKAQGFRITEYAKKVSFKNVITEEE